jgi:hypothetical protein
MTSTALVATRKGLFRLHRKGKNDWDLDLLGFRGDPVSIAFTDPRTNRTHAALNLGHFGVKLHRSDDRGKTWTESAVPVYPESADQTGDRKKGKSLVQIWSLTHGGKDRPGVLWAGTIPGGLFRSDDDGETWNLNEPLWNVPGREAWFGGGYDDAGIHSVCVDPRNSDHVAVAVSCGGVWLSEDAGKTWACKTKGMYAEYMPPDRREDPTIQDPHILVQSPSSPDVFWVQHHNGVFRSRNRAEVWDDLSPNALPSKFGFVVAVHPQDPDTAWFAPAVKDECRIPVDGRLVVSRTRDGGRTFQLLHDGLPQKHAYDLIYRHAMDVDDSGDRLAMGSTTGGLWVSENGGDSWSCVSAHLPPIYAVRFEKAV